MKRPIVIIAMGILFLFVLTVAASPPGRAGGERIVSKNKAQTKAERKKPNVETTPRSFERDSGVSTYESEQAVTEIMPAAPASPPDVAEYDIPWQSINAGGGDLQSTSYEISSSVGQSVIGYAASDNYEAGMGYWYGMAAPSACDCGVWGDVTGDGQINPQDVTFMQQHVFFTNDMRVQPPNCPLEAGDVANCDGQVNPQDVTFMVQYVFFTNDMFCPDPCGP